jgi:hypothetical protein
LDAYVLIRENGNTHCEPIMNNDRQTLLELLREELEFLGNGGYRRCARSPWRAAYIFEESPSCPNFRDRSRPHQCEDCWLMEFVSPELREEQVPCRFVELAANGVTVDSLYRSGSLAESEEALRNWLHRRIHELEGEIRETSQLRLL